MLQILNERLMPMPLTFSSNVTDPETPGETGDPEPPDGKIKPPTSSQPTSREGIKPPTATSREGDDSPGDSTSDPPIIIDGGN